MLASSTLQFLEDLRKNNNKEWFDANRSRYQQAKSDVEQLVTAVIAAIARFDPSVAHLQAKDCVFRINRDVRFSKDKSPYKTNMGMYISKGGKKALDCAGYYVHIEPGGSFLAGGLWMPMAPVLKKVRQEIDYNFADFRKIISSKPFRNQFGDLQQSEGMALSRPPKGYEPDNEAIEYLKLKSFIASLPLADELLTSKQLLNKISISFQALQPLIGFLNRAVEE